MFLLRDSSQAQIRQSADAMECVVSGWEPIKARFRWRYESLSLSAKFEVLRALYPGSFPETPFEAETRQEKAHRGLVIHKDSGGVPCHRIGKRWHQRPIYENCHYSNSTF
jgi:hypothetical protein